MYSVVYLKELEDGIQYKTNICIVFIAIDDSYVCTVCEETNTETKKQIKSISSENLFYAPNFEKVDGAYCFWSVRGCVRGWVREWVTLFVPTVTFKPLKLES